MPQNSRESEGEIPELNTGSDGQRDNQQMQDDNQTSGESVSGRESADSGERSGDEGARVDDRPNQASDQEPAEGSRENAGGISNRPLDEEEENQERVPPRGDAKDGSHA